MNTVGDTDNIKRGFKTRADIITEYVGGGGKYMRKK